MLVDVIAARVVANHRVFLQFEDGLEGELDLGSIMPHEGLFASLHDPQCFAEMRVNPDLGTICWPNGADFAPETLYKLLYSA